VALVTFHTIGADRTSGLRVADDHALRLLSDVLGYFRMPLFAFLSGVVYALRPIGGDARQFIGAKVRRLLVPMLTVGTLFAVLQANTPGASFHGRDWALLHIQPVAHYWFLESLFLIFMLIVLLERRRWLGSPASFATVWLASAVLFVVDPLPRAFGLQGAVYLLPFVLLGIGCRRFADGIADSRARHAAAALLCLLAAAAWILSAGLPAHNSTIALGLGASGCVFLLHARLRIRALAWLGTYSYSIFLFHSIFSAASRVVLTRLFGAPFELLLISGVLAGLALPVVVELALKRIGHPIGFWLLGQKPPRKQTPPRFGASTAAMPL
jgi:fucose 4-O-acetylase-like acetyltransferase